MLALNKAQKEIANGNLWRAKEILQGSITNAGYNCDLFEQLGTVLLMMGDLPEAGRFLFLSGREKPEYEESIKIFLGKHSKNWRVLWQTFPRAARLSTLSHYPDRVGRQLAEVGFPEALKRNASSSPGDPASSMSDVVGWLIIGSLLAVMFLGILKVIELVRWIF